MPISIKFLIKFISLSSLQERNLKFDVNSIRFKRVVKLYFKGKKKSVRVKDNKKLKNISKKKKKKNSK